MGSETQAPAADTPPISGAITPCMGWDASSCPVTGSRRWIVPFPPSASLTISVLPSGLAPTSELSALGSGIVSSAATVAGNTRMSSSDPSTQIEPPA